MKLRVLILFLFLFSSAGHGMELFGKGTASRTFSGSDRWTLNYSIAGGIAFEIIPRIRIEGRYTNRTTLQNALDIVVDASTVTLTDVQTKTDIYGLGIDIDFLGKRSSFRPFIYVGGGYLIVEQTFTVSGVPGTPIKQERPTLTVGAGFRLRLGRSIALEFELFGYPDDLENPTEQLNLYGNVGVRLYI